MATTPPQIAQSSSPVVTSPSSSLAVQSRLVFQLRTSRPAVLTAEIRVQKFPDQEPTVDIQTVDDACICSSLHIQGAVTYKYYHRCPVHNDTMEHNRTRRNTVTGHLVHRKQNTPQPVEDSCICSSVHIHGNLVNVHYSHRCPIHNDTMEHDCTIRNIVTGCGNINLVQSNELPLMACTLRPVEDTHISSPQHIQAELPQISDPKEQDYKRNILAG